MIDEKSKKKKIILKNNSQEGKYFQLTNKRYLSLKKSLDKIDEIELSDRTISVDDLTIEKSRKVYKITAPFLKNQTKDINLLKDNIKSLTETKYRENLESIYEEFRSIFKKTTEMVTLIDYYTTIAKVSKMYNYCRPIIDEDTDTSYIEAIDIRHPIVERIIDTEYITNDINIGRNLKGMMLYGLNAVGKSILMKASAISVIMAQAGFFVSCSKFTYHPYKAVYTRITANDNLFRGMSSYTLEMHELNAILARADKNFLVVGDEICHSTEITSAISIVTSAILSLLDVNVSFIFTSHLHSIMDLEEIKNRNSIKAYHLSTRIIDDKTIYDRKLTEGYGIKEYGIQVARAIIKIPKFIEKAMEIKKILLDEKIKISKYNSDLIVDACDVCGCKINNKLETHHLNQQKDCKNGFVTTKGKTHIQKNNITNLMVVCDSCHDKIHQNIIDIEGYKMTDKGKQLIIKKK
jgi:DNA mismatch repair protein MutS